MADVDINKFRASVVRDGSKPASPGFVVSEGQDPVNPPGTNNYVPYSGATANVELGEFGLEAGFITLDTTPTNTPTDQGTIYWDDSKSTAALIMNGTTQHIGQDTYFYVKNSTGSSIPKGTAVRFDGTDGASGHLKIAPFLADGTYPSTYFMGVTAEAIGNGEFGQVMHFGELEGINTSGYTAGALLYASTTSAGGFQTTAPVAPNNIVLIAAAVNSKNNGAIIVRPTYGSNINDDEGVKIVSPTTGDLLQLQASGLWENKTKAQVLGGTSSQFVKGDGSVDSTAYGTGTVTSVGLSSATSGVTIGSTPVTTSGTITLAIATASGSQNGLLSSTDWTTFNSKQNALTNPVTGTGTTNYLPKFTGTSTIGNSQIFDNGTNVGINTNTPLSTNLIGALTIVKSYSSDTPASTTAQTYYTNQSGLYLFGRNSGFTIIGANNEENQIIFANTSTVAFASINTGTGSNSVGGDMYFKVGSNTERMRIFSDGNVGINTGTTNAGYKLDVNGTGRFSSSVTAGGNFIFDTNDRGITSNTSDGSDNKFVFICAGGARGSDRGGGINLFGNESGGTGRVDIIAGNVSGGFINLQTSGINRLIVTDGGNVGIGTSSPDVFGRFYTQTLGISSSGSTAIQINGGSGGYGQIDFGAAGVRTAGISASANETQWGSVTTIPAIIYTNGSERMRITSGGNVLIGTTTDNGAKLQVNGSLTATNYVSNTGSTNTPSYVLNRGSASYDGVISWTDNTSARWKVGTFGTGSGDLRFFSANTGDYALTLNYGTGAATFSSSVTAGAEYAYYWQRTSGGSNLWSWSANSGSSYLYNHTTATSILTFLNNGSATFSSSVTATSFITSSDTRLKEIIERDGDLAVYKRKGEEQMHYGYLAQEMQEIYPNQVHEDQDGFLSLNYVEILVKKVNELEKKIKQLEK